MKKTKSILALVFVILFALSAIGCGKKNPADVETFYAKTAEYGLEKTNLTIDDDTFLALLKDKGFALKMSGSKAIICEFYVTNENSGAAMIYAGTKSEAESIVTGARSSSSVNSGTYSYIRYANSEVMCILARIENTVLYIRADKDLADDADGIAKALGYK